MNAYDPDGRENGGITLDATRMFDLISAALFQHEKSLYADQELFAELTNQTILALSAPVFSSLNISGELRKEWKKAILELVSFNERYFYVQSILPITVPYVILKGTSAAQYYPHPEFRTMGDIDIITRREDYETAYQELLKNGYAVIRKENRETALARNGICIELHRYYASLNNVSAAQYLDDLIIENINPSHVLPDMVNGLVLLEHISQHLEHGLGLRQIIDWMMFVDKCLTEENWKDFYSLAQKIGLEKLAIATTHMCELYLGLPGRKWSEKADNHVCKQLMDYILSCGNFGNKRTSDADISENVFAYASTVKTTYKLFKPFAWIYQANRYIFRGLKRNKAVFKLKDEYTAARKRNKMFQALGVKTAAKRIVVYKNGKYVKE